MRSPNKKRQRQTVHFTTHIKPSAKVALQCIAQAEGLPTSRVGAVAIEEWLARRSHIQHRGIFQPMIEHAVAKEIRAYSSRLAALEVRNQFIAEQTRAIVYNILRKPPALTLSNEAVDKIMDDAKDEAKRNIGRADPKLEPVLRAIEQWLEQGTEAAHD